ncbi:hypothetical protein PV11_03114 [Exophiala sideris]|uniref:Uncharacterized protein n=1 Tax=Exophiala sideris TaxID=1016849 RepID=A0A0D1WFP6_9EURO|nr:hypothetical protein PV11_03114 [Exophiala sideris]
MGSYATVVLKIGGHVSRDLKKPLACPPVRVGGIQITQTTICSSSTHDKRRPLCGPRTFSEPQEARQPSSRNSRSITSLMFLTNNGGSHFSNLPNCTRLGKGRSLRQQIGCC